jgi:hypothetical protein
MTKDIDSFDIKESINKVDFNKDGNKLLVTVQDMLEPGNYQTSVYQVAQGGLFGAYYSAPSSYSSQFLMKSKVDKILNFTWSDRGSGSVRWNGFIRNPSQQNCCTFYVHKGNIRLWIDGYLIIDAWDIDIGNLSSSGYHDLDKVYMSEIILEIKELDLGAEMKLLWDVGGIIDLIPSSSLFWKVCCIVLHTIVKRNLIFSERRLVN